MTTYLADTNILINALNDKRGQRELLNHLVSQGHRLACCTVTLTELFSGIRSADLPKVEQFVSLLKWYAANQAIARHAGQLRFRYARKGITLSLPDMLIAATALEHGLTLITENRKHFPIPELPLYPLPESSA
jgi:predicted nucleic acid-binding protein